MNLDGTDFRSLTDGGKFKFLPGAAYQPKKAHRVAVEASGIRIEDPGRRKLRPRNRKHEVRGQNANQRVASPLRSQRLACDAHIAPEPSLPKAVCDHDQTQAARQLIVGL